jgi:YD repeat-containing protein
MIPAIALGGVNLKNGNFYITYTDIIVPGGGHDLEITRTYNSKSSYQGWFGYGWGSLYETYLQVAADGSVIVHENGSGAVTRFLPKGNVDAKSAAKRIVDKMRKQMGIQGKEASQLIKKLSSDAELRQAYAKKFDVKASLASGTVLHSTTRGIQTIEVTKDGFVRRYNDGKVEEYNKAGKMLKMKDKHGYFIKFNYSKAGNLKSLKDSLAKQLFFEWYADGHVKHIWSVDKKKTKYDYKDGNLVESMDVAKNTYKYGYDATHNLTSVTYLDGSAMKITYHRYTQFVTSVTSRNGDVTKYKYEADEKNPDLHFWTLVTKKNVTGKMVTNRYEYEMKVRPDGSQYTYRILTVVGGVRTETFYHEKNNLPIKITRGKFHTNFKYNDKGLLVEKRTSRGDFVKLSYDPKLNKITKVVNNKGQTDFIYRKGSLYQAKSSDGKLVTLLYDHKGRITKMINADKKVKKKQILNFKYNAQGKPIEIAMDKVGKIRVMYDNYGEIKKVESKAGHRMAMKVTQAFQSLLSIVKPAGVNLNL